MKFSNITSLHSHGVYYTTVHWLSDEEVKDYQSMGFQVRIPKRYDCSSFQYVKWTYAKVLGNIDEFDENDPKYSLAQKLWIITKKSRITNNRFNK